MPTLAKENIDIGTFENFFLADLTLLTDKLRFELEKAKYWQITGVEQKVVFVEA